MNHVGHANWLLILMRARADLLKQAGVPFESLMQNQTLIVVAEINIRYLRPAVFGDRLTIDMQPQKVFSKGFVLHYQVLNQENLECVHADIVLVFVDGAGKSIAIPEKIKALLFS